MKVKSPNVFSFDSQATNGDWLASASSLWTIVTLFTVVIRVPFEYVRR